MSMQDGALNNKCHPPESNWGHTDFQSVALPTELGWLVY
jgi:hypothetical protein